MITTRKTKNIFLIAISFFVFSVLLLIGVLYQMNRVASQYKEKLLVIEKNLEQEQVYNSLEFTIQSSRVERAQLEEYILTKDDTISFLTEIEQMSRNLGIVLRTKSLEEGKVEGSVYDDLRMAFDVEGTMSQLENFVQLLELLPYHGQVQRVNFNKVEGEELFSGDIIITISLIPHD